MRGRGLLILLATMVVLLSGLSSLRRPSEKQTTKSSPATPPPATVAPKPQPGPVTAKLPADGKTVVKPGQTLNLQISSASPDIALISGLGLKVSVGPDVAGDLVLVAPSAGSYPVTLQISKRTVGEIVVSD